MVAILLSFRTTTTLGHAGLNRPGQRIIAPHVSIQAKVSHSPHYTTTGQFPDGLGHGTTSTRALTVFRTSLFYSSVLSSHYSQRLATVAESPAPFRYSTATGFLPPPRNPNLPVVRENGPNGTKSATLTKLVQIRLRASGSSTTLPHTMWLKPDSAT